MGKVTANSEVVVSVIVTGESNGDVGDCESDRGELMCGSGGGGGGSGEINENGFMPVDCTSVIKADNRRGLNLKEGGKIMAVTWWGWWWRRW